MPSSTDISALFETKTDGANVTTRAPVKVLLKPLLGGQVSGISNNLDRLLALSNVEVISTFEPKDCNPKLHIVGLSDADSDDSNGGDNSNSNQDDGGTSGEKPVLLALAQFERGFQVLKDTILATSASELSPTMVEDKMAQLRKDTAKSPVKVPPTEPVSYQGPTPTKCSKYLSTIHGPTGLFRFSDIIFVKVAGTVQTLGGINTFNGDVSVLTRVDYSINTFLNGVPGWVIDEKSGDAVAPKPREVQLPAVRNCGATETAQRPCGTDIAPGVMEVYVRYKKVFIGTLQAGGSTAFTSAQIEAAIARQTEAEFRGTVPFTHFVGANKDADDQLPAI